ncbi:MAG: hypothetical protein QXK45_07570 [Thermofilaceae archaeon]
MSKSERKSVPLVRFHNISKRKLLEQKIPVDEYLKELAERGYKESSIEEIGRCIKRFLRRYKPICEDSWYKFLKDRYIGTYSAAVKFVADFLEWSYQKGYLLINTPFWRQTMPSYNCKMREGFLSREKLNEIIESAPEEVREVLTILKKYPMPKYILANILGYLRVAPLEGDVYHVEIVIHNFRCKFEISKEQGDILRRIPRSFLMKKLETHLKHHGINYPALFRNLLFYRVIDDEKIVALYALSGAASFSKNPLRITRNEFLQRLRDFTVRLD